MRRKQTYFFRQHLGSYLLWLAGIVLFVSSHFVQPVKAEKSLSEHLRNTLSANEHHCGAFITALPVKFDWPYGNKSEKEENESEKEEQSEKEQKEKLKRSKTSFLPFFAHFFVANTEKYTDVCQFGYLCFSHKYDHVPPYLFLHRLKLDC